MFAAITVRNIAIAVVGLAILAATTCLLPTWVGAHTRAQVAQALFNANTLKKSLDLYFADHFGRDPEYPADAAALLSCMRTTGMPKLSNPFSGKELLPGLRREVNIGDQIQPGDLVYVPLYERGKVAGYAIFFGDVHGMAKLCYASSIDTLALKQWNPVPPNNLVLK